MERQKGEYHMDDELLKIPYAVHEGDMARMERANRRLWILCILLFLALVVTNAGWIWYESQWVDVETMTESYESDASDGGVAIANGSGRVNYNGEGKMDKNDN